MLVLQRSTVAVEAAVSELSPQVGQLALADQVAVVLVECRPLEQPEPQILAAVAVAVAARTMSSVEQVDLALSSSLTQYLPHHLVLHPLLAQRKLDPCLPHHQTQLQQRAPHISGRVRRVLAEHIQIFLVQHQTLTQQLLPITTLISK